MSIGNRALSISVKILALHVALKDIYLCLTVFQITKLIIAIDFDFFKNNNEIKISNISTRIETEFKISIVLVI